MGLVLECVFPKVSAPPSGETNSRNKKSFGDASMMGFRLCAPLPEGVKEFDGFLSVMLLSGKVCERDFAIKAFQYGNDFEALEGKFIVVHTPVQLCICVPTWRQHRMLKLKIWSYVMFSPLVGDKMKQSR